MISSGYIYRLWLITVVVFVSVSVASLDWQSDTGQRFQWAYNCEFNGSDITTMQSDKDDECGLKCHENSECTHFTWQTNTCYLKHFANQPTAIDFNKFDCGWISSRGTEPQVVHTPKRISEWKDGIEYGVKWAKACQFYGPDESNLKTILNRTEDLCRADCAAMENCTNFNWNDGKCDLKMFNYPVPAYNYDGLTCGFVTRSNMKSSEINPGILTIPNRDGDLPTFPLQEDLRLKSSCIVNAHEVLRKGLQQYLQFQDTDLGTYLSYLIDKRRQPFTDEYGQIIQNFQKVFRFIWEQYNETLVQNYAIDQFNKDKLDLCSVARFLSHQSAVNQRETIIKRMGDALGYKCHPCTPYTPKQWSETIVPSTDGINPEEVSLEESAVICKESQIQGQRNSPSFGTSTTLQETTTTTSVESIKPENESFDYIPCSHSNGNVVCDEAPLKEVQKVFERTSSPRLASVQLTLQPYIFTETYIPTDVFGTKRILDVWIGFPLGSCCDNKLEIDANAFRSTKSYTTGFTINVIDCTQLDFGFLSGFDKLTKLVFDNIYNIQHCLSSLPPLPRLTTLHFANCFGMNELHNFPVLTKGLKDVEFSNDDFSSFHLYRDINDETIDRVMTWLLLSSANTLEEMAIFGMNQVTRVPQKIAEFKALRQLWLHDSNISIIQSGAFSFSVPVSIVSIIGNGIKEIKQGAFHGDFKDAVVALWSNNLTRFEESVFGPILSQMASGKGFIDASCDAGNPIDCSEGSVCHLSWLRRYKADVKCSNGTSFKDLQPTGFNHCV